MMHYKFTFLYYESVIVIVFILLDGSNDGACIHGTSISFVYIHTLQNVTFSNFNFFLYNKTPLTPINHSYNMQIKKIFESVEEHFFANTKLSKFERFYRFLFCMLQLPSRVNIVYHKVIFDRFSFQ